MMNPTQEAVYVKVSTSATQATLNESDSISLDELQTNAPTNMNKIIGRWTYDEHRRFLAATRLYGRRWKKIAASLGTRTATQVRTHALKFDEKIAKESKNIETALEEEGLSPSTFDCLSAESGPFNECQTDDAHMANNGRWSREEHNLFLRAVLQHGKGWTKISASIKTRSALQVRTHAQKFYAQLVKANQVGDGDWIRKNATVAIGSSSSSSIVSIPTSPSSPFNINLGRWSEEEHRLFLVAALEHGRNWKKVARVVETRTPTQVRTHAQKWYFQRLLQQKLQNEASA